jgi:MYXO-CTERM domain-containing protein
LVVLSACQTHLGELSRGDELVGLERAFIRAGSPSLLTTLWRVDDAATAELMERFYTHLRAGSPKAEALRLAQTETCAKHPEPYYWAGFVLVGDAGAPSEAGPAPQQTAAEVTPTPQPTPTEGEGSGGLCGGVAALLGAVGVFGWRRRWHGPCGEDIG